MKYPKEYLEEIKSRLKVSTVVSKFVAIKKRGKEFVGLSPFKNEKTPSFTINDEKGFYHCFSTGEHGNIFDFLMKTQNLKFGEAVRTLANQAGLQPYRFTKQDEQREKDWNVYTEIYSSYIERNKENITSSTPTNKKVLEYLKKRNLKYIDILKSTYIPFLIKFKIKLKFDLIKTNQLWGAWIAIALKLISFKPLFIRTGYDIYKFSVNERKPIYKRYFYYLLTQVGLIFCNTFYRLHNFVSFLTCTNSQTHYLTSLAWRVGKCQAEQNNIGILNFREVFLWKEENF